MNTKDLVPVSRTSADTRGNSSTISATCMTTTEGGSGHEMPSADGHREFVSKLLGAISGLLDAGKGGSDECVTVQDAQIILVKAP